MSHRHRVVIVSAAVVALAVAGCSRGDGSTADVDTPGTTTRPATETTGEMAVATTLVDESPTTAVDGTVSAAPSSTAIENDAPEILWEAYSDDVELGVLDVPIDYDDPSRGTIELALARHRATSPDERIGTLFVNPGGPGFGGSDYGIYAPQVFADELIERFDIIGWDPRGTGFSEPAIDCVDDLDPYLLDFDATPDDDAERQDLIDLGREFADACRTNNADIVDFVGTNNSARDIDAIRRALGEDEVSYFGFSYGGELGAVWVTLFPDTVRAAVLDGGTDPEADSLDALVDQMVGFNASMEAFLEQCTLDESCAFHSGGDPTTAYLELIAELDESPLDVEPDRPPVNGNVAIDAVFSALYSDAYWPALAESLAAARDGDGSGLLALVDRYNQRAPDGTYGNELEAFRVISCVDSDERTTPDESDAEIQTLIDAAPLLIPEGVMGPYFCEFFPDSLDPRADITGDGAGPVLVIGTTGDPATPLESTRAMADALDDGRLVVVDAEQHLGYGVNECVIEAVNRYLIDLEPPDDETTCD